MPFMRTVLHHLSEVVGGMRKAENGQSQARIERWDRDRQLVQRCERIAIVERRPLAQMELTIFKLAGRM
jgi:hypothetical protein